MRQYLNHFYTCPRCKKTLNGLEFIRQKQILQMPSNDYTCIDCGSNLIVQDDPGYLKNYTRFSNKADEVNVDIIGYFEGTVIKNNKIVEVYPPFIRFYDNGDRIIHQMYSKLMNSRLKDNFISANMHEMDDKTTVITVGSESWKFHTKEGMDDYRNNLETFIHLINGLIFNAVKATSSHS